MEGNISNTRYFITITHTQKAGHVAIVPLHMTADLHNLGACNMNTQATKRSHLNFTFLYLNLAPHQLDEWLALTRSVLIWFVLTLTEKINLNAKFMCYVKCIPTTEARKGESTSERPNFIYNTFMDILYFTLNKFHVFINFYYIFFLQV